MNNQQEEKNIKDVVLSAIEGGKTAMRPKWHFAVEKTAQLSGLVITLIALVYLVSFMLLLMRENGLWWAPLFGSRGWLVLLRSLPWTLIAVSVVFVGAVEILVRRYAFAYRKPLLFSLLAILTMTTLATAAIIPFHRQVFRAARTNHLPPFAGGFYRRFIPHPIDLHTGKIIEKNEDRFVVEEISGETSTVIIGPRTRGAWGYQEIEVGARAAIFGDKQENVIRAYGIRLLEEDQ